MIDTRLWQSNYYKYIVRNEIKLNLKYLILTFLFKSQILKFSIKENYRFAD